MDKDILLITDFFKFIPFYFLLLYPFGAYKKEQAWRIPVGLFFCFSGLFLIILFCHSVNGPLESELPHLVELYGLSSGFLLLHATVSISIWSRLFMLFLAECYINDIIYFVWIMEKLFRSFFSYSSTPLFPAYDILTLLVLYVLTFPLAILFLKKLLIPLLKINSFVPFLNKLWCLPCIFFFLFYINIMNTLSSSYIGIFSVHLSWTLGTFFSCGFLLQMMKEWINRQQIQNHLSKTAMYLKMQRHEYERLREVINKTRKIRHDMRQHMTLLQGLAQQDNITSIREYIHDYLQSSGLEESTVICENYAINALIQYYISQAKEAHIQITAQVLFPQRLPLPESDLASIIGNMLENAIEACRQQKEGHPFIAIKGGLLQTSMIAFTVRNSYETPVQRQGDAFLSTKRDSQQEGIGISSISHIAQQYNGTTRFKYSEDTFEASVLLNP